MRLTALTPSSFARALWQQQRGQRPRSGGSKPSPRCADLARSVPRLRKSVPSPVLGLASLRCPPQPALASRLRATPRNALRGDFHVRALSAALRGPSLRALRSAHPCLHQPSSRWRVLADLVASVCPPRAPQLLEPAHRYLRLEGVRSENPSSAPERGESRAALRPRRSIFGGDGNLDTLRGRGVPRAVEWSGSRKRPLHSPRSSPRSASVPTSHGGGRTPVRCCCSPLDGAPRSVPHHPNRPRAA